MVRSTKKSAKKSSTKTKLTKSSISSKPKSFVLTPFRASVYAWTRRIERGNVATYQSIAIAMGKPNASRAVGNALRSNPYAPIVPCHRVVSSSTLHLNGYQGNTDMTSQSLILKTSLLKQEGIHIIDGCVDAKQLIQLIDCQAIDEADLTEAALKLPSDVDMKYYATLVPITSNDSEVIELE